MSVKCAKKSKPSLCDLSGPLCSVVRVIRRDFTTEAQRTTEVARRKTFDPAQPARHKRAAYRFPRRPRLCHISDLKSQISNPGYKINWDLFFLPNQHSALVQIRATQTVSRPRHGFEPLLLNRLAAVNALSVLAVLDAQQRIVDRFQQLPVICRHRHQ